MSDMKLQIRINADGSAAVTGIQRIEKELGQLDRAGQQAGTSLAAFAGRAATLGTAAGAAAAAIGTMARSVGMMGDEIRTMEVQMTRLAASGQGFGQVAKLADDLGMRLTDAAMAANFFTPTFTKMGKSFQDSTQFISDLNRSLQVYGVNGSMAASVTTQLAQGFSSGVLQGDELKSLSENAAGLYVELERAVQAITGSSDPLKQLGSDGKVTSEVLYQAFTQVFDNIRGEFAKIPSTIEKEENRVANAWDQMLANLDKKTKASEWWQSLMVEWRKTIEGASTLLGGSSYRPNQGFTFDGGSQQQSIDATQAELERRRDILLKTRGYLDAMAGPQLLTERAMGYQQTIIAETKAMDELGQTLAVLLDLREREASAAAESAAKAAEQAKQASAAAAWSKVREQYDDADKAARAFAEGAKTVDESIKAGGITKDQAVERLRWLKSATLDAANGIQVLGTQLKGEEKIIADLEKQYGLYRGELMAVWEIESKRGKIAGVDSRRWVTDQKSGKRVEIVGEFQMQPSTAAGVGGDLSTWEGQAIAAAKELARLKSLGFDIGERLAGYHGGQGSARNPGPRGRDYVERGLRIINDYGNDIPLPSDQEKAQKAAADAARDVREAMASQIQTAKETKDVYASLTQPLNRYIAGLKAQDAQAGLTAEQQARLNAEMEVTRLLADARATQQDLAWEAAQKARKTGEPVDMRAVDEAGKAIEAIKAQKGAAVDLATATVKAKETTKEALPTIEELWAETVKTVSKGIQGDLSSAFEGLFNGTLKDADDFMDALKKTIVGGLAKLAAAVLMQPINVVINTALSGSGGLTTGQGGSTGAGGSILTNLGSMFSGTSMGGSAAASIASLAGTVGLSGNWVGAGVANVAQLPNGAFGASGLAGGLIGSALYPNSQYSSIGGSLGGMAGMTLAPMAASAMGIGGGAAAGAMAGSVVPVVGTIIGAIAGAVLGGALGGGKDDTPQKEAFLTQQVQRNNADDASFAMQQSLATDYYASVEANQAAYYASVAEAQRKHAEALRKISEERAALEQELSGLLFGETKAREAQLNALDASNRHIKAMSFAFADLKAAATALQSQWQQLANSIASWTTTTRSALFGSSAGSARAEYQTQLAAARAGDMDAMAGLTGYADRYLAAIKSESSTRDAYQRTAASVLGEVSAVGVQAQNSATSLADITGETNKTLQEQYALTLRAAQDALSYYQSSGQYDQANLEQLQRLNLGSRSTSGFSDGGISTGPTSGYPVTLHGTEAIIPLRSGAVPVTISWEGMLTELRAMGEEIRALRLEQQRQHHTSYTEQREAADILRRWETIGQPEVRTL